MKKYMLTLVLFAGLNISPDWLQVWQPQAVSPAYGGLNISHDWRDSVIWYGWR